MPPIYNGTEAARKIRLAAGSAGPEGRCDNFQEPAHPGVHRPAQHCDRARRQARQAVVGAEQRGSRRPVPHAQAGDPEPGRDGGLDRGHAATAEHLGPGDARGIQAALRRLPQAAGRPEAHQRQGLVAVPAKAQRETFDVPEDDRFMVLCEHAPDDLIYGAGYLGIRRSDDLVLIQMTVSNTRPPARKQALFRRIAERLAEDPGVRPEDVFINLVEVAKENWSFGNGEAQYALE